MQQRSDRLEIIAFHSTSTTNPVTAIGSKQASAFCGVGLGADEGSIADGADAGIGIQAQSRGPFVVRFITDDVSPMPPAITPVINNDELGFSIHYQIDVSCEQIQLDP